MLTWLILHTLAALVLALLALVLGRWLRLGPAARHALWLVVLLKLLTPPVVHWPWALPLPETAQAEQSLRSERVPHADDEVLPIAVEEVSSAPRVEHARDEESSSSLREGGRADGVADHRIAELLGVVWLGGGVYLALQHLARLGRIRRGLSHVRPPPRWLAALVGELCADMGLRPPRIGVLAGLGSPFVWGCGQARLLWPEGLEDSLPAKARRAVLVHELAHLRRRDHWVGWLLLVADCVWWWHPVYWWVRRQLGREAELACDAWVVAELPDARRQYAEALLTVCQRRSAPAAPALGAAGKKRDLERRLLMVMRDEVPSRLSWRVVLGVCGLALLALPALTTGQAPAPAADFTATPKDNTSERERKVQDLEKKVEALLKELKALRAEAAKGTGKQGQSQTQPPTYRSGTLQVVPAHSNVRTIYSGSVDHVEAPVAEVSLTRATYSLPAAKAEALSSFLRDNVKASVLETKHEGDKFIVTTTPEAQRVIAQLIALMQGKRAAAFYDSTYRRELPK